MGIFDFLKSKNDDQQISTILPQSIYESGALELKDVIAPAALEVTPKNIRDEIAKTKDFAGVTGKISLNADRNAEKSAVIVQVQGPERKFITTITP